AGAGARSVASIPGPPIPHPVSCFVAGGSRWGAQITMGEGITSSRGGTSPEGQDGGAGAPTSPGTGRWVRRLIRRRRGRRRGYGRLGCRIRIQGLQLQQVAAMGLLEGRQVARAALDRLDGGAEV